MKIKFSTIRNKKIVALLREIGREADRQTLCAYVVGGFVRDLLLKRDNLDVDIVIEGDAIMFAKRLAHKKHARMIAYSQFGTATVTLKDGFTFDLVSARREVYASSGALPQVQRGTLTDDLFRRDFSINALALALHPPQEGELIDEFGGLEDLKPKKIRVLHQKSFIDDPTRIFRAIRYEQRLSFRIEGQTNQLLKEALRTNVMAHVKPPRIFEEFRKMLEERNPIKYIQRLSSLGIMNFILPGFRWDRSLLLHFRALPHHYSAVKARCKNDGKLEAWIIYFMILLMDIPLKQMNRLLSSFHLRKDEKEKIQICKLYKKILKNLSNPALTRYDIYKILHPLSLEAMIFCRMFTRQAMVVKRIDDYLTKRKGMALQIGGKELWGLGIEPGKRMGFILESLLKQKINKRIQSRSDELRLAKTFL